MHNFTAADLVQTTWATFAFALFFLPPGYLLGLASNVFGMRSRSAAEKVLFSVAFSVAATPILAVLLTRISSYKLTLAVFLLLALISLLTVVRQLPLPAGFFSGIRRSTWILLGMMLAWFLVVQLSLADLQMGHRLYVSLAFFDHSIRVPLVEAAARGGVPPGNPFYGLGKVPVLRYFYYACPWQSPISTAGSCYPKERMKLFGTAASISMTSMSHPPIPAMPQPAILAAASSRFMLLVSFGPSQGSISGSAARSISSRMASLRYRD